MPQLRQSDAEIEHIVQRSAAVRAVRWIFLMLEAAVASSVVARALPRQLTLRSAGVILITAAVTHAAIVSFVPASAAPAGRYLFSVSGILAGALLLSFDRIRR